MKTSWNVALGFYQNLKTAEGVLRKLKKEGLNRSAYIHREHYGKIIISHGKDAVHQLLALLATFLTFLFLYFLTSISPLILYTALGILSTAVITWSLIEHFFYRVNPRLIHRYEKLVISDETLVIVQVKSADVPKALSILRHVESGHPTSFLLRPYCSEQNEKVEIVKEPLTMEALNEQAQALAMTLKDVEYKKNRHVPLLKNLRDCEKSLQEIRHAVAEAEFVEQTITLSAEWLLDNTYVIQGNIEEVIRNLPKKYYQELPKILSGPMKGLPRIYLIAKDIVRQTANRLSRENIIAYLNSYQTIDQLTIGELWVLPLMLRLRLIECLNLLSKDVDRRLREGEYACFWGNRLLNVSKREPNRLSDYLDDLKSEQKKPSSHFAEELIDHLYDEDKIIPPVRQWLEEEVHQEIHEMIKQEQLQKTTEQIALSNAIVSLITLSQLSWREIFEQISFIDRILSRDPSGIYSRMDFNSRDSYRHAIETFARRSKHKEAEIASRVLQSAESGKNEVTSHVGYYLVDEGRYELERALGYKPNISNAIRQQMVLYPSWIFLGGITSLTIILESILAYFLHQWDVSLWKQVLFMSMALIPASEISVQIMSLAITKILQPVILPKLAYEKGIPEDLKTLVVVPSLLTKEKEIKEDIDRLEIHYLANSDKALRFGIFYDFTDAPEPTVNQDPVILEIAVKGIKALNDKYNKEIFFLFLRNRVWSPSEDAWIGRERKRGKLESLNHFLVTGSSSEVILKVGLQEDLKGIRYVITLDADTDLPKDTARKLIETISHPLNKPYLDEKNRVQRGYTIIQPRVGSDITHLRNTWFSKIFSDAQSINPYTQVVSDIYQDLMSEGNYHGKAIYDVQTFHKVLDRCFPEEHILSHDLLEGVHVRVGFASDIVLSDKFPQDYYAWSKRQHRWMRGDWQIMDWIFPVVPCGDQTKKINPLSLINRWKIFDNLRRSLLPISLLILLCAAFLFSKMALFWVGLVLIVFFIPPIFTLIFNAMMDVKGLVLSWKEIGHQFLRSFVNLALLPQQAYLSLDVILRVFFRRWISHKKILEWHTFHPSSSTSAHRQFVLLLTSVSFFAVVIFALTKILNPSALFVALPFSLLWFFAPLIVNLLDKYRIQESSEKLSTEEQQFIRYMARKTWRYFDDFVGPQSNWLPPDNYQAALTVEVAHRTSPTNIGLWMLAVLTAHDFKYISSDDVIDRLLATCSSFKKLEMYEGHFLNWYDTQTLKPLYPRYVSTVDSGNLLASFWTLEQGIYQLIEDNLLPSSIIKGLRDTYLMLKEQMDRGALSSEYKQMEQLLHQSYEDMASLIFGVRRCLNILQQISRPEKMTQQQEYWFKALEDQLLGWESTIKRYFSWIDVLSELRAADLESIHPQAMQWRDQIFKETLSLKMLASTDLPPTLKVFLEAVEKNETSDLQVFYKKLKETLETAQWFAGEKFALVREIISDVNRLSEGLNMRFLYNEERKLFSIGYHVDDCRLDNSYYDLLASEARIASFVAIAKDDVPLEHWWALGRPFGYLYGRHVLMSWGGTMFEYLMPLLFKNIYPDTLMTKACQDAVACQKIYAQKRGIPWGISEAAYSAIDSHKIYQYRSFGVPGLGFKRGLEEDLVVSPYSTALALAIDPESALANLKHLKNSSLNMLNDYGYFESIDFSRQNVPEGERGVIVYAYMAHHQGMSLLAFSNILNNNILRKRFHANPRVIGMESLLCERAPAFPPIAKGSRKSIPISRLTPFPTTPIMGIVDTPHSATPKVNLLSNGVYSLMITNSGGGYSSWRDIDITRWRADTTADNWGSYYYIKDLQSGRFWSAAFQPVCLKSKKYSVSFKADRTEFKRIDHQIEVDTEMVVSPIEDAEVRLLTLANLSQQGREIELTSYIELALAPHAADAAHPCFNKLFIETENVEDIQGIIAFRRMRSENERPIFAGHIVSSNEISIRPVQFETDRSRFLGRGKSLASPTAMEGPLSNSTGFVLDPIFSLRYSVHLKPGQRVQVAFITVISDSREKTLSLLKKYADLSASQRAIEMAWAHAQLELRHLRIHQEEVQLFQKLASRVLYPHAQLRPSSERLIRNKKGQSGLWAYGISGDLPIVVVTIADLHEMELVKQVITAHVFWRLRGLKTDLVILNEESTGYEHPLLEQLQRLVQSFTGQVEIGQSGGVFILNSDQIPEEDLILILSVARANLIAARGSLRQQLVAPMESTTYPARIKPDKKAHEYPSESLPFVELQFFNSLGGFSPDGREYMIFLSPDKQTPAPWINVIANPNFGTMVSESGLGSTWYGNSQTNRLTPWSNDPVLNPISDTIYIRDDELGTFWSPTPSPIRELDPYRIRHGQGYSRFEHNSHGIEQDLTIFVPVDDQGGMPVRIQKLKLKNTSPTKRRLSIYGYTEWVLGIDREKSQMHIITQWDPETQSLFAVNRYNPDYGDRVAFATSLPISQSFSANRAEFLGRNGHISNPAALKRKKLSGLAGAAFDPCATLQVYVELNPNEEKEVVFFLGYADDETAARKMVINCREPGWVKKTYLETLAWWDRCLGTLYVNTPDPAINYTFNRWLLYQNLSCRFWGRTAFYQSSGAYGFRDQLQDAMALVYSVPTIARQQILRAASRQFVEGDVQHWWHPPNNGGVRTRISDDLLWLPFVTAQYIRVTGDAGILNEQVSFIKGELLKDDQHEVYFVPETSEESANLLEHCRRALRKGLTEGPHGLPLIGGGDWNDGMNRVGIHGKGESVWLAWFLVHVMNDFADLLVWNGQPGADEGFRAQAKRLAEVIEETSWDGNWYRRAYFDDGTPLGSIKNQEDTIDALPQAWAVISGAGNPERIENAFKALEEYIIKTKEKLVLLLTPPFDKTPLDPGYIKGYPPGVRENGGQYTHGSLWVPLAYAMRGLGDQAVDLLKMMHPIAHTSTKEEMMHFKVEPYVLAADIYTLPGQVGRGGWTWYTGSSGWMYRILLEEIFGFKLRGNKLQIHPVMPKEWDKISLHYQWGTSRYDIHIQNSPAIIKDRVILELDGKVLEHGEIELYNDGHVHQIIVKSSA
ncbi:MAG: protein ndvB [Chlamydiales bacterium 38-26]|nr:hypothetical protein [Chlamydiales bacterium]OJV11611.1 MAG: protein ndvB [Chlamydiales bacterium 38-26]